MDDAMTVQSKTKKQTEKGKATIFESYKATNSLWIEQQGSTFKH